MLFIVGLLCSSRVTLPDCVAIGGLSTVMMDDTIKRIIQDVRPGPSSDRATRFLRARVKGTVYHSELYSRMKTRNSYTVCYRKDDGSENFGSVQYYLSLSSTTVVVITPLTQTHIHNFPRQLQELDTSIVSVKKESSPTVVPVGSFLFKCVCVDCYDAIYIAKPPYSVMYDD